jgi:6-phosphofructokinase 1
MGRDSGFIAATTSLANSVVDFCLIPELPFQMSGPDGLCMAIEDRLKLQKHAVVVVAEGAGQELFKNQEKRIDQSGNILKDDIGELLKTNLSDYFKKKRYCNQH